MEFAATQAIEWEDEELPNSPVESSEKQVATLKLLAYKDLTETNYPIYKGRSLIGRSPSCNIQIVAASLSKEHAAIEVDEDVHLISDLNSVNKTKKGKLTLRPNIQYELKDGDVVKFGDVICHYYVYVALADDTLDVSGVASDCILRSDSEDSSEETVVEETPFPVNRIVKAGDGDQLDGEKILLESDSDTDIEMDSPTKHKEKRHKSSCEDKNEDSNSFPETQLLPWGTRCPQTQSDDIDSPTKSEEENDKSRKASSEVQNDDANSYVETQLLPWGTRYPQSDDEDSDEKTKDPVNSSKIQVDDESETQLLPWGIRYSKDEADLEEIQQLKARESGEKFDEAFFNDETQPYPCFEGPAVRDDEEVPKESGKSEKKIEQDKLGDVEETDDEVSEEPEKLEKKTEEPVVLSDELGDVEETDDEVSEEPEKLEKNTEEPVKLGEEPHKLDDVVEETDDEVSEEPEKFEKKSEELVKFGDVVAETDDEDAKTPENIVNDAEVVAEIVMETPNDVPAVKDQNQNKLQRKLEEKVDKAKLRLSSSAESAKDSSVEEVVFRRGRRKNVIMSQEEKSNASTSTTNTPDSIENVVVQHLRKDENIVKTRKSPVKRAKRKSTPQKVIVIEDEDPVVSVRKSTRARRKVKLESIEEKLEDKTAESDTSCNKPKDAQPSPSTSKILTPKRSSNRKAAEKLITTPIASHKLTPSTPKSGKRKVAESSPSVTLKQTEVATPRSSRSQKSRETNSTLSTSNSSSPRTRKREPSGDDESKTSPSKKRCLRQQSNKTVARVMFTGMANTKKYEKIVSGLGGEVTSEVTECTHLVTDKVRRTCKLLCVLSRGCPIVTPDWLTACQTGNCFVDEMDYLIKDSEAETKFEFSMEVSLSRAAAQIHFLADHAIHVTSDVKPTPSEMKTIIECAGGKFSARMPSRKSKVGQTVIVSCVENAEMCRKARQAGIPVVSSEFILTGVLRQKSQIDLHQI